MRIYFTGLLIFFNFTLYLIQPIMKKIFTLLLTLITASLLSYGQQPVTNYEFQSKYHMLEFLRNFMHQELRENHLRKPFLQQELCVPFPNGTLQRQLL